MVRSVNLCIVSHAVCTLYSIQPNQPTMLLGARVLIVPCGVTRAVPFLSYLSSYRFSPILERRVMLTCVVVVVVRARVCMWRWPDAWTGNILTQQSTESFLFFIKKPAQKQKLEGTVGWPEPTPSEQSLRLRSLLSNFMLTCTITSTSCIEGTPLKQTSGNHALWRGYGEGTLLLLSST